METNDEIFSIFAEYVSAGKVRMYKELGVNFIPGKREGCWIYDLETGMKVINLRSSGGVFNLGHDPLDIKTVLIDALNAGMDMGDHMLISRERAIFGRYLASLLPGDLKYTTFGVSGGEAIDVAIKLARAYTKKPNIISTIGGYHGHTGLAMAAGTDEFKAPFKPVPSGFLQVPFGDIEAMREIIDNDTAAVILETIQATAGVIYPTDNYYQELRDLCTEQGVLLIMDEVQSGLGRTGKLWAIDEWNVVPDIMVLGKGTSGGIYPLSLTCYKPKLQSFFDKNPFIHISTAGGSDLACVVATKMLEKTQELLPNVNERAKQFAQGLAELQKDSQELIQEIRQKGLFIGIEFIKPDICLLFMKSCLERGILAIFANNRPTTLIVMPPLIINKEEVDFVLNGFSKALKAVTEIVQTMK